MKPTYTSLLSFFALLLALLPAASRAAAPDGYYKSADGLKKQDLKTAMRLIISKAKVLEYGSGAGKTWTGFYTTDRMADGQVIDRYSNDVRYFPSSASTQAASAVSGMNIEHSFPKSWWGGTNNQAYKDLFNLMPCESQINSSKSNYAMGKVTTVSVNNGCTKVGKGPTDKGTKQLWEPADKWKGDFARDYFYMVTAYSTLTWTSNGLDMLENNEWPTMQKWAYTLLLQWCKDDPVDDIERKRNDAVYSIQGNRNPSVDYPNLAEYIWGDSIDYAFSIDGSSVTPTPDTDPEPQPELALLLDEPLTGSLGSFTTVTADGEPGSVWKCSGTAGAVANAYTMGKVASEYMLVNVDLTYMQSAYLTFDHSTAYNYQNVVKNKYFEVLVCDDYEGDPTDASWSTLNATFPSTGNSQKTDYVNAGYVNLNDFCGRKVTVAFFYLSTSSACYAWQVRNFKVYGEEDPDGLAPFTPDAPDIALTYDLGGRIVPSNTKGLVIRGGRVIMQR